MACGWIVIHRIRTWRRRLYPGPRREKCGKPGVPTVVSVGSLRIEVELCRQHARIAKAKG
jgi:hypothetical protein